MIRPDGEYCCPRCRKQMEHYYRYYESDQVVCQWNVCYDCCCKTGPVCRRELTRDDVLAHAQTEPHGLRFPSAAVDSNNRVLRQVPA